MQLQTLFVASSQRHAGGGRRRGGERGWKNKIKHRDQLICTVINREETLQRSARRGVNPGVLLLNAPTWQGPFIWLMDYILRVWSLLKHPAQRGKHPRSACKTNSLLKDQVNCREHHIFTDSFLKSNEFHTISRLAWSCASFHEWKTQLIVFPLELGKCDKFLIISVCLCGKTKWCKKIFTGIFL